MNTHDTDSALSPYEMVRRSQDGRRNIFGAMVYVVLMISTVLSIMQVAQQPFRITGPVPRQYLVAHAALPKLPKV